MSKFRTLLGGLAAVGMLAAVAVGGVVSVSSTGMHGSALRAHSLAATSACISCVVEASQAS